MSAVNVTETTIFRNAIVKKFDDCEAMLSELRRSVAASILLDEPVFLANSCNELVVGKHDGTTLAEIWPHLSESRRREMMVMVAKMLVRFIERTKERGDFLIKEGLIRDVREMIYIPEVSGPITMVHGDLGLSNIMLVGKDLRFIDFEHVVLGPLALELAPGLFWRDKNCLPTELMIDELNKLGIDISITDVTKMVPVYEKLQLLANKKRSQNG